MFLQKPQLTVPGPAKQIALHGLLISKHAARVTAVSAVVAGTSFLVINAALLTMQISSLPLFLKVGGINLSLQTPDEAKVLLAGYGQAQTLSLNVQGKTYKTPAYTAGVKLNTQAVLASAQHPTGWNKIPLIYAINNHHRSFPLQYSINNSDLTKYVSSIKLPKQKSPVNATIVIPASASQPAYIAPASNGYLLTTQKVAGQITEQVSERQNLKITAKAEVLAPTVIAQELSKQLSNTNSLLNRNLTLSNGVKSYKLTVADLRQIITITKDSRDIPRANIDQSKITEFLQNHSDVFYLAPTDTKISEVDGQQVAKSPGASGRAVNIAASTKQIAKALQTNQTKQALTMSNVDPDTAYLKNYTATSAGLSALINDFVATHNGSYQIATIDLKGNRSAYYNQNQQTIAASTYKVFVAFVALQKVEQGKLSMSSQTSLGSLDYCLQRMIKISDNNCAHAILDLIGWQEAQNIITLSGFTATQLNISGNGYTMTSANDLANFLKQLYNKQLLNDSDTNYLLNLMEHQIYRDGIPAGSHGALAADKVGELYNYFHDAGIIYAPNSNYVLVVMSNSGSYSPIKDLADEVYELYNQ